MYAFQGFIASHVGTRATSSSELGRRLPFGFSKLQLTRRAFKFDSDVWESQAQYYWIDGNSQNPLGQQKTASGKERVQALYLLKTKQVETVQHLAVVLGRNRVHKGG